MEIIQAKADLLPQILPVYARAREFMAATGNPNQWGKTSPSVELLQNHIANGNLYALCHEGRIVGAFAMIPGEDPTYNYIEGSWNYDLPYAAIHSVASDGSVKGLFSQILEFCSKSSAYLRIDTHHDNKVMQHVLEKHGFMQCGVIYLENGDPRIAYDRKV